MLTTAYGKSYIHPSTNASAPPILSTPNHHLYSDLEPYKTTTDASAQTPAPLTRRTPTTGETPL